MKRRGEQHEEEMKITRKRKHQWEEETKKWSLS